MPFRRTVTVLPLLIALAAAAAPQPDTIPAYKDGLDAMAAQLWDVASTRFEAALATPDLDAAGRRTVLLRLAETGIRAGDAESALKILADPALAGDPDLPFWTSQALAASGKFAEALALLDGTTTAPAAPHRREALFTRAALQVTLGDPSSAIAALEVLSKENDAPTVLRAKMDWAAILLDQGKPELALAKLPPPDPKMMSQEKARSEILRARAELGKGEYKAAIALYSAVLQKSDDPAFRLYRTDAAAGLARAQLAAKDPEAATDGLLAFIEQERDSPRFGEVFTRLLECLPNPPTVDDIILMRLREWCPPLPLAIAPAGLAEGSGTPSTNASAAVWPSALAAPDELATQALFHLALGLRREGSAESKAGARRLLVRLRTEYPAHPLASRALLETIRWDLEDNRKPQAAAALATLEDSAVAPSMRAGASLAAASSAFAGGDFALASTELDKAAALLDGEALRKVTLNAAITRLAAGDLPAFDTLAGARGKDPRIADDIALERALFLTAQRDPGALAALDKFILDHPQHARLAEARLAAAHAALDANPPDVAFAKAQLGSIPQDQTAALPAADLALARIRIAVREKRWEDAAALAETFLKDHPDDAAANAVRYELGNARFENKDYNKAMWELRELATKHPQDRQADPALFLAARAAALGGTSQAQEQSLVLYDRLIAGKGPLADVARIYKVPVQISLKRLDAAVADLQPWFQGMKKGDPLRVTAGLLLGDALYGSAGSDSAKLERTIALYEDLLGSLPASSESRFEIEFRRGLAIDQPKTPEAIRKACDVYYSVLQAAAKSPPANWHWVDQCGARALLLLESQQDWKGAIGVAKKHALLGSPGAKEAAAHAAILQQEHWEW
ncbi:tetratricopeptide repeat protein [Luteolibacter sp. Populi]|uniref:tetratricopeptide repeat protein n=1 Tax=Luteolibacter sp. Populi TaxID=3230487 RepID=UPI0034650E22